MDSLIWRSPWKTPDPLLAANHRPTSPIAPTAEPLSPLPTHQQTPALNLHRQPSHVLQASPFSGLATGASVVSPLSAPPTKSTSSTASSDAAVANSNGPITYTQPSQQRKASSFGQYSQYPIPPAYHDSRDHRGPATKRARSEVVATLPQPYPFSTTAFMNPQQHTTDRNRRQSSNAIPSEDAELLLNFASRVQPRPSPSAKATSPLPDSHAPSAPLLPPSVLSPPTLPVTVTTAPAAELAQGTIHDPSASLPSPQHTNTNEEERLNEDNNMPLEDAPVHPEVAQSSAAALPPPELRDLHALNQTQTPPDDEQPGHTVDTPRPAAVVADSSKTLDEREHRQHSMVESTSADTAGDTDTPKPRPRRGWPKGKPRGPRNKTSVAKPRSTARRSRASAKSRAGSSGTPSYQDLTPPIEQRRKSETDLTALIASGVRNAHSRQASVPPNLRYEILPPRLKSTAGRRMSRKVAEDTICSGCSQTRESTHGELDQWIGCNGCKGWFHYDCAGFKNERDVRDVDKFFCKSCEPQFGATTYVRKSSRSHTNVDYAGLNLGILKTSDEDPEHHYVQPIKDGTYAFDPETFPRMRPELVTAEYFETSASFNEPILIPAAWNPKRQPDLRPGPDTSMTEDDTPCVNEAFQSEQEKETLTQDMEYETAFDDGQDKLGMVIPQGLTVRHVANIVGPDEPLEVIDVKTQGTEGRWNLAKFADYYEADGDKPVRNVISLEVSHTKLGKLLQRPKVVRDIDLQDSVWPAEESAKGNYPKVQFYCLMSVADAFTDFHIDFGGSGVYYHILRGRKTFFFIPPKPSHLKAYEDWNNSPEQNFTWLPTKTKECYRVDLYEGDTMLIPSGWIHAVWTPTNSLVIGGNFLTRLHYSNQFRVVDIEKANKTPLKFRYPQFQKVMWYTVIKYLETDPLPKEVAQAFYHGSQFHRERPVWQEFFGDASETGCMPGAPDYNARYYPQAELDGLPELLNFIFRTVMISLGRIEGVSEETRKKVVRSIPKSHGDPLDVAKSFALWVAWKRGDEDPPAWAHPDADLPDKEAAEPKKLSARALKQLQRQEAINAYRVSGAERTSARQQASKEAVSIAATSPAPQASKEAVSVTATPPAPQAPKEVISVTATTPAPQAPKAAASIATASPAPTFQHQYQTVEGQPVEGPMSYAQYTSTPKTSVLGPKRVACDACRKRRIRCKHKEQVTQTTPAPMSALPSTDPAFGLASYNQSSFQQTPESHQFMGFLEDSPVMPKVEPVQQSMGVAPPAPMMAPDAAGPALVPGNALLADSNSKRGRSKACFDCRKSKRRCVHDENGKLDPVKAEQTPVPRGSATKKRKSGDDPESPSMQKAKQPFGGQNTFRAADQPAPTMPYPMGNGFQQSMPPSQSLQNNSYADHQWQQPSSSYMYPDPDNTAAQSGPYHHRRDSNLLFSQQSLEQLANDVLDSRYVNNDEDGGYTVPQHAVISGAAQPGSHQMPQHMPPMFYGQSSDDSAVAMAHGHVPMGGPVQEMKPAPQISNAQAQTTACNGGPSEVQHQGPTTMERRAQLDPGPVKPSSMNESSHEVVQAAQPPPVAPMTSIADSIRTEKSNSVNSDTPISVVPQSALKSPQTVNKGLSGIPLYEPPTSAWNRRPSKPTQPVDLFSDTIFATPSQQNGRQRRSFSKTPGPMAPPSTSSETPGSAAKKRKRDSNSSMGSIKKVRMDLGAEKEKSAAELQEEESARLARDLQDQEWGLRRRSREAV